MLATNGNELDIAIVGMAGRFPGADSPDQLWQNVLNKEESISFFNDDKLIQSGVDLSLVHDANYVVAKGYRRLLNQLLLWGKYSRLQ